MTEGIYGKKCPKCEHINEEFALACEKCHKSLSRISARYHKSPETEVEEKTKTMPQTEDIQPQPSIPQKHQPTVRAEISQPKLRCETYPFTANITDGAIIGREGTIDISSLPKSDCISRKHASFIFKDGDWYIRVCTEPKIPKNKTKVNSEIIEPGQLRILKDGDKITLADTTFIFRGA